MTCCPLLESSAVLIALAHVRELEKQLKDQQFNFSPEASVHLEGISAAVAELEAVRCAANQCVQVQITENNKLRSHIVSAREQMSQYLLVERTAVRKSFSQEIDTLIKYLDSILEKRDEAVKIQEAIMSQNDDLQLQLEEFKGELRKLTAGLQDRVTSKHNSQKKLGLLVKQTEKLKCYTAAVAEDRVTLQRNFQMERENILVSRDELHRATHLTQEKITQQKDALLIRGSILDRVNQKKLDTTNHLGEFMVHMARLKSDVHEKTVAVCQCEEQLRAEIQKQNQLKLEHERVINELSRMENGFKIALQISREERDKLEGLIARDKSSRLPFQDSAAQILELLQLRQEEENKVTVEHLRIMQQLEQSQLQLEGCLASNHKHKKEASDLDRKIIEFLEADTVANVALEKNLKELRGHVDMENQNITSLEEEKQKLIQLLDKAKIDQERQVTLICSDTSGMKSRFTVLQHEEAEFLNLHPTCAHPDQLLRHITLCEREYMQLEQIIIQQIRKCTAEREIIARNITEKLQLLEEKERVLMEIEAECSELRSRHNGLLRLSSELKSRRDGLEASAQRLEEKTSLALKQQKQAKGELEIVRATHLQRLHQQATELKEVEVTLYNYEVQLEQVRKENQLIHLRIWKMTEEVRRSKQLVESYKRKGLQFHQVMHEVKEGLQSAWMKDHTLIEFSQDRDRLVLVSLDDASNHFRSRGNLLRKFDVPPQSISVYFHGRTRVDSGQS